MIYTYLATALVAAALAGTGAWRVQSWRYAAKEADRIEAQREKERNDRRAADQAAGGHEQDKTQIRTVYKTIVQEVDRVVKEPFYVADPACLDAAGLRILEAAIAGRADPAGQPAPALPGPRPPQ